MIAMLAPALAECASDAAGDLTGIDVENLAGCADAGKCRGIGAGHPDLRAKF